jgi:apolipoprotein N-acyltransferase
MAFVTSKRTIVSAIVTIALSATLFWIGNGMNPVWPLIWVAPLPVLMFATRHSWWSTGLVSVISMLLGSTNMWTYLKKLGVPPTTWFSIFFGVALLFALSVLLFRALLRRNAYWSAFLAFPATWVSYEFTRNFTTPHGTAGSLAYSQLSFLPFLQLASITGPWGMSFVLLLFPASIAIFLYLRSSQPRRAWKILCTALGIVLLVLAYGQIRLLMPIPGDRVKVGLATSDLPANDTVVEEGKEADRLFQDYGQQVVNLAAQGAQVVVLPEKLAVVLHSDTKNMDALFQSLSDRTNTTIVVGVLYIDPPAKYNRARTYSPHAPILNYDKEHMLPPFESPLKPGTTLTTLDRPSGKWGVEICKDMDFTPLARKYGQQAAGLMLIPGWDFNMDSGWHGHIAVMRAVEDGFSMVRAAKNGYLTISDNRGRVFAEARSDSAPFATLLADVPTQHENTLFLLWGDWFAWVAVGIFLVTLLQLLRVFNGPKETAAAPEQLAAVKQ